VKEWDNRCFRIALIFSHPWRIQVFLSYSAFLGFYFEKIVGYNSQMGRVLNVAYKDRKRKTGQGWWI